MSLLDDNVGRPQPRCICGLKMKWISANDSWACPETTLKDGVPRPQPKHLHFVDPKQVRSDGSLIRSFYLE